MRSEFRPAACITLALIPFFLPGCSSSSGGGKSDGQDRTAPTVASVRPADGAGAVAVQGLVSARFSENIDCATVTTASFTLVGADGGAVDGSVTCDGAEATFAPSAPLTGETRFTATLSAAVKDPAGNPLAASYSWQFTTRAPSWGAAHSIDSNTSTYSDKPRVAVDAAGNALAVWQHWNGTRIDVIANRYAVGEGWGTPALLETGDAGHALVPTVALNAVGNGMAVWNQSDGVRYHIWARHFTPTAGWGAPAQLEAAVDGSADAPAIALDPSGNALAIWQQSDGTRTNIWSNRYTAGAGWGSAELVENADDGDASAPAILFDASGNALAVWSQHDGVHVRTMFNRYTLGQGWGSAAFVQTGVTRDAQAPQLAMDANGNGMLVWHEYDGSVYDLWYSRYTAGGNWSTAELLAHDDGGSVSGARLASDAGGNATVIWYQSDGTRENVWSRSYTPGDGWAAPTVLDDYDAGDAYYPEVAMDQKGNALALWLQYDESTGSDHLMSRRYSKGSGWSAQKLVENESSDLSTPRLALDAGGTAIAVWQQADGAAYRIWSNRLE